MSFCRLLLDTRPLALFVVSLWCFSRFSRSCSLSVVDACRVVITHLNVFFLYLASRDGYKPIVFVVSGGANGDRRLNSFWMLNGLF
jgi:hypothetical protein